MPKIYLAIFMLWGAQLFSECLLAKKKCANSVVEIRGYQAGIELEEQIFKSLWAKSSKCKNLFVFLQNISFGPILLALDSSSSKYLQCRNLALFHQRDKNIQKVISECAVTDQLVNINSASLSELMTKLELISEHLAQEIISYRQKNQGIKSCQELQKILGVTQEFIKKNMHRIIF